MKQHSTFIACLTICFVLIASSTWHLSHRGGKGGTLVVPSPSLNADGTPAATEPASSIDWVLIGNAIGSLIAAVVGMWELVGKLFHRSPAVTISPTAESLGDDIVAFTLGTGTGPAYELATGPAYELAMRIAAEKLLAKYTVVRKP